MGWFDYTRSPAGHGVETLDLPLFPLSVVLFPGGSLPLKLFEQRYLDMAAACLREQSPFGICLIRDGREVGLPAVPHEVGTLARIGNWEMEQLGILHVTALGSRRFRILETRVGPGKLLEGTVELLTETVDTPFPAERQRLQAVLQRIISDMGSERLPLPHRFDSADWVGCRIIEVLPVHELAKQKLLELDDPLARLEIIEQFLEQRGLLE